MFDEKVIELLKSKGLTDKKIKQLYNKFDRALRKKAWYEIESGKINLVSQN